ncbi:MAG TPA: adenylate/guanylate cyclase domain-containing protein [Candidatus Limnocylindria bacterium]
MTRDGGTKNGMQSPSLQVVSSTHGEEELRLVTVVFADLADSTAMAEGLTPEEIRGILTSYFNALASVIQRFGGTVDKYAGDAVMAVFGAPLAHEDDAVRALRTAIAMQNAIARLSDDLQRDRGIRLALRVGVNTGPVAAGVLRGDVQAAYTIVGDAVNVAYRLQSAAGRGEVLVGAATERQAAHAFSFERIEPLHVKGKTEPLTVFRLTRPRDSIGLSLRSTLVGRENELATLSTAVEDIERGEGRIALIIGVAGIGKSRLLADVRRAFANRRIAALEGRALAMAQGISYLPFTEIIRRDADIAEDDAPSTSWEKFERRMRVLFAEDVADVLPYLGTFIGLELPDVLARQVRHLDAQSMGLQIFASMRSYVRHLTAERPTILVLEDWHWADESSAALLEHLLPLVETERLGICVASRPDEPGSMVMRLRGAVAAANGARFIEVRLEALGLEQSEQLVRNLLLAPDLTDAVRTRTLERAEGNPLFLEELVSALIDLGAIVRDPGSGEWRATDRIDTVTLPDTVQGVIVARIDRLDDEVKHVLRLAAVIGRSFLYRVLRALREVDRRLDSDLAQLQQLEFIRERRRTPELEYIFKHALVHDAAYESLLLQRRKELHARVGEVIEELFANQLDEFCGVLAYHYARAERWEKAQEYLFKAGDRAERIAGDAELLAYYKQAVAVYARAFGNRWDPVQRAIVERKIAEAHFRRGEHLPAREAFQRCLDFLGIAMPVTRWRVRAGVVREALVQVGHLALPRFLPRRRHDPAPYEWMRALGVMTVGIDYFLGDTERLVMDGLRLLNLAEANDYRLGVSAGSSFAGLICGAVGLTDLASRYHARAVAVAEEVGDTLALGIAHHQLAMHEVHVLGDLASADKHYSAAMDEWHAAGEGRWPLVAIGQAYSTKRFLGEWSPEQEVAFGEEIIRAADEAGDADVRAWGWVYLGIALADAGDLRKATQHLERSVEFCQAVPDHAAFVVAQGHLAEVLLALGSVDRAVALAEDTVGFVRQHHMRSWHVTPVRNALVHAYLTSAEREQANGSLARTGEASRASLAQAKRDRQAAPGAYRWRGSYEWLRGDSGSAREWWGRSEEVARALGAQRELDITRQERARFENRVVASRR